MPSQVSLLALTILNAGGEPANKLTVLAYDCTQELDTVAVKFTAPPPVFVKVVEVPVVVLKVPAVEFDKLQFTD